MDALRSGDLFATAAALDCDAAAFDAAGMPLSAGLARDLAARTLARAERERGQRDAREA